MLRPTAALAAALLLTAACGKGSDLPASATYGPDVKLAAPGEGRADPDAQPGAGRRLAGGRSADGAGGVHRDPLRRGPGPSALALPAAERDVLVVETNSPPRQKKGLTDFIAGLMMKRAGAPCPAPTASPCCATPTATASRSCEPSSSRA